MKNIKFLSFYLLFTVGMATIVFNSYGQEGVMINGVKWATCNVDAPGTFAAKPEYPGMFYQWNRKKGWPAGGHVTGWDDITSTGTTWEKANDPSPIGWRVPTLEEIQSLLDTDKVTNERITQGMPGIKFTDKATNASIFLPAAGYRYYNAGELYYAGSVGIYWNSTQYGSFYAYNLRFSNFGADWSYYLRRYGFSVRSVAE